MKITEDEVEVEKHPSVIAPLLSPLFLFANEARALPCRLCHRKACV